MATNTGLPALKAMLSAPSVQQQFGNALKENKDSFIVSIIDLYGSDPQLQKCDNALIVKECLRAATMRLPINRALGFAYVVVFNNSVKAIGADGKEKWEKVPTPSFILSYKGYIQLAMRTGQYKTINADVIYDGELVKTNKLTGEIDLSGVRKSDKVVGYFAHIELINGFSKTLYMTLPQMAEYAKKNSRGINSKTTVEQLQELANAPANGKQGWEGDFNAMGIKTCLRRLIGKYGILSTEMQTAMENEILTETATETVTAETPKSVNVQDVTYTDVTAEPKAVQAAQPQAVNVPTAAPEPETITVEEECGF